MNASVKTAPTVKPVTGTIGADIHGLDLSRPLDAAQIAFIRAALLDHGVLFFREQAILSADRHKALAGYFGELETAPFQARDGDPKLLLLDQADARGGAESQGANFHSDNTFRPCPPMGAVLQAHVLPERGGDTCFASMHAAYAALSPGLRHYLEGLEAWHSLDQMVNRLARVSGLALKLDREEYPPCRHPVIATHRDTGRKLLNVNYNWTTHIDGIPTAESNAILGFLYEHIKRPDFQVRCRWQVGDVVFWDNCAVQHCAVPDYVGRRLLQRVAIAGTPG